jgi:hypothetical protein
MADRQLARLGGALILIGSVLGVIFNLLHPRTTSEADDAGIRLVAGSDSWVLIHTGILVTLILIFVGLLIFAMHLPEAVSAWARLAIVTQGAAAATGAIWAAVDGVAAKEIIDEWASASGTTKESLFAAAQGVEAVSLGTFFVFILMVIGLAPFMYGIAVSKSRMYPAWLGSLGTFAGAAGIVVGIAHFLAGPSVILTNVIFTIVALLVTIFIGALGWYLYRGLTVGPPPASEVRQQVAA